MRLLLVLVPCVSIGCGAAPAPGQRVAPREVAPDRLELRLVPETTTCFECQPVRLKLLIHNPTERPLEVPAALRAPTLEGLVPIPDGPWQDGRPVDHAGSLGTSTWLGASLTEPVPPGSTRTAWAWSPWVAYHPGRWRIRVRDGSRELVGVDLDCVEQPLRLPPTTSPAVREGLDHLHHMVREGHRRLDDWSSRAGPAMAFSLADAPEDVWAAALDVFCLRGLVLDAVRWTRLTRLAPLLLTRLRAEPPPEEEGHHEDLAFALSVLSGEAAGDTSWSVASLAERRRHIEAYRAWWAATAVDSRKR